MLDHHPWHHNHQYCLHIHQYCLHIHHHQHQRPFWAKNSLHTTASMGMVVKTPFYTWCPDDYILHLVSFHDHDHHHHAVTVIIITAVVTLHVGRQCSHPCRGRSLHSGDAAIKQPRHRRQQHKRQHDININTRVFITKVNTWSRSSTILEWPLLLAPIRAVAPPGPFLMRKKIRLRIRRRVFFRVISNGNYQAELALKEVF